ncbi:Putative type II secretion system protein E [Marinomonas spartinae]|uniref:Putative type II secretion system protein E n=1 Tax=Marinomonas spartinae TaxID=1792290 RepID=A0A1A8TL17_9GAMM|nr:ATPase, T2SS/T4P/T4SS family [Marinomonas spartinae]SBS34550.1 Putative type II secretion system protein E [Marinomonas spartinae]SBS38165.1 Putative type II secretion system protein E [Marinomonas spartinae]
MTLEEILLRATQSNATDIHIEQTKEHIQVSLRHLGQVSPLTKLDASNTLINRVKMRSNLDLSETRRNQEGQFTFSHQQQDTFVRVSIIATVKGEKVAMRLLPEKCRFDLDRIGMPPLLLKALKYALDMGSGLILACGATGAGKSTTLYSCLNYLNKKGNKTLFTIEDPVEYEIPNVYQCEPNPSIGQHPTTILKSLLRQDPDVIMIGEIRDSETANLALSAALTGHLVLATLHTNSALDAVYRCHNWNVDFFSFVSSVRLIIHQNMNYQKDSQHARFTALAPRWQGTLPLDYQTLLSSPKLWCAYNKSNIHSDVDALV